MEAGGHTQTQLSFRHEQAGRKSFPWGSLAQEGWKLSGASRQRRHPQGRVKVYRLIVSGPASSRTHRGSCVLVKGNPLGPSGPHRSPKTLMLTTKTTSYPLRFTFPGGPQTKAQIWTEESSLLDIQTCLCNMNANHHWLTQPRTTAVFPLWRRGSLLMG